MNNKIPKIYVNKIDKINNNKEVYYSALDKKDYVIDSISVSDKIKLIFDNNFIYKKKVHVKTKNYERDFNIISKSNNCLLTLEGYKINIDDIIDIDIIK